MATLDTGDLPPFFELQMIARRQSPKLQKIWRDCVDEWVNHAKQLAAMQDEHEAQAELQSEEEAGKATT